MLTMSAMTKKLAGIAALGAIVGITLAFGVCRACSAALLASDAFAGGF